MLALALLGEGCRIGRTAADVPGDEDETLPDFGRFACAAAAVKRSWSVLCPSDDLDNPPAYPAFTSISSSGGLYTAADRSSSASSPKPPMLGFRFAAQLTPHFLTAARAEVIWD